MPETIPPVDHSGGILIGFRADDAAHFPNDRTTSRIVFRNRIVGAQFLVQVDVFHWGYPIDFTFWLRYISAYATFSQSMKTPEQKFSAWAHNTLAMAARQMLQSAARAEKRVAPGCDVRPIVEAFENAAVVLAAEAKKHKKF